MASYYNEIEPFAAQWLKNLIAKNLIAKGEVDERSIADVSPNDLSGFTQCHFFAGIGVWSHALRLAEWSDDRPVWTGSCPCQSFSAAGRGGGFDDSRHLWPHFFRLIREQRPVVVFGEQVASSDGLAWLDFVCADLETEGYAVGALDTCAAGFGAPHIRQRLYFVADAGCGSVRSGRSSVGSATSGDQGEEDQRQRLRIDTRNGIATGNMGDASGEGSQGRSLQSGQCSGEQAARERSAIDSKRYGTQTGYNLSERPEKQATACRTVASTSATKGFWRDAEWLPCTDGKARPVEPGTFPLAHGAAARVGRLRAYGNAIIAPQASEFIKAFMECRP